MSDEKFDAIIVGGGIAGASAGIMLARQGLEVLIIERGNYAGAKNMTGGRLYAHCMKEIFPNFSDIAPIERKVTKERISMMTENSNLTIGFTSDKFSQSGSESYTVLRSTFDRWMIEQAEEAGAMVITGILVEDLIKKDGKVCGIIAGEEEMYADVVILADGANSRLMDKAGLQKEKSSPHQMAVGAKEVIELGEEKINDRFNLENGEGAAWLFAGYPSDSNIGGGFLYTNKDTISLGIVITIAELEKAKMSVPEMLERFKSHPDIAPVIKSGKLVEYSGHMVAEGGYHMVPSLYDNGILAVGDAAHLVINLGYTVRGMDLAVGSAIAAAKAVIHAKDKGDFSASTLSYYKTLLDNSFVMQDLKHCANFSKFMEQTPRIFNEYPKMASEIFEQLFVVNGSKMVPMKNKVMNAVKKVGIINLLKDMYKGSKAL